jgi:hypothetical protein
MVCVTDHHGDVFVVDTIVVDRWLEEMTIVFEPTPDVSRRVGAGRGGGSYCTISASSKWDREAW